MRFSRKHLLIVVVAVLATISLLAFPFSASAAQISIPGINDTLANTLIGSVYSGSVRGSLDNVQVRLDSDWSGASFFEANSRSEYNIYPPYYDIDAGRNVNYDIIPQFHYDLTFQRGAELKYFNSFYVHVSFYVRQEYNFNANSDISNAYFFQSFVPYATVNGHQVDIRTIEYFVQHAFTGDPYYDNGYYFEAMYEIPYIDPGFLENVNGDVRSSYMYLEFDLRNSRFMNAYPDQQLMVISNVYTFCEYSYKFLPWENVPLSPEVVDRIDSLGMSGSLVNDSAGAIGLISSSLADKTPHVDLDFSVIGDVESVDTGASFFSDLFSFLITNTICQSFVSVGILFAFVTFILRR